MRQGDVVYYRLSSQDVLDIGFADELPTPLEGDVFPAVIMRVYSVAERTDEYDDLSWARRTFSGSADLNVLIPGRIHWIAGTEEDDNPQKAPVQYGTSLHVIPSKGKFTRVPPPEII